MESITINNAINTELPIVPEMFSPFMKEKEIDAIIILLLTAATNGGLTVTIRFHASVVLICSFILVYRMPIYLCILYFGLEI